MNELFEYQKSSLKKLDVIRNRILRDYHEQKNKYKNHLSLLIKISNLYSLIMVTDPKTLQASMTKVLDGIRIIKEGTK
jgi:hypothetical protein